jgi:radical SAM protein with 4Fe4S-binding SPASM domain
LRLTFKSVIFRQIINREPTLLNELILRNLIRSLNFRRSLNLLKTGSSFVLSSVLNRPIIWGKPAVLTIEPTNTCNLRCPLCTTGSGEMQRVIGQMSPETFRQIMEQMGEDIFFLLLYHQGEPYINKHFLEFVRLAKEKNIYCTTSTNAHFITDETIHATIDSGLDSMIVSLDGVTQETYARYRVKGNVEKVLKALKRFMEIKRKRKAKTPLIALQFLVMKHNEHELPAIRKLARDIGVDRLLIKNIEVRNLEEARTWLPRDKRYRRYKMDEQSFEVKNSHKKSCPRPWLSTLINWDGSVVPCCFDKNASYQMGNIKHAGFEEIWKNDKFTGFRDQLNRDRKSIDICRNCNQGFGSFIPHFSRNGKKKKESAEKEDKLRVLNQ